MADTDDLLRFERQQHGATWERAEKAEATIDSIRKMLDELNDSGVTSVHTLNVRAVIDHGKVWTQGEVARYAGHAALNEEGY